MSEKPRTDAGSLPTVRSDLGGDAILERLDALSRRGKLPGFRRDEPAGLFSVDAQGTPFDKRLIATASSVDGGTELTWELRLDRKMPGLFLVMLIVTVWPGLPITDSMLSTYWGWYSDVTQGWFRTWMWYVPFVVLPLPWMWVSVMRKSDMTSREHAGEMVEKVRGAVG